MPIEITDWDDGCGNVIEGRGVVSDRELIDSLQPHLAQDQSNFKDYKYILIDQTDLTKLDISDETVEVISGLIAETSKANPDPIVALVAYASYGTNIEHINRISRLHELFIYPSCWETRLFRTKPLAVKWIREKVCDKFEIDDLTFC
jgi:hypothetical protein